MKLHCIGTDNAPCLILRWNGVTIMLDCGLDLTPLLQFLPAKSIEQFNVQSEKSSQQKLFHVLGGEQLFLESNTMKVAVPDWGLIDLSTVDVLLISNSSNMLALPYLTEYTDFKGIIYATEPTIQIGRHFMKELVLLLEEQSEALQLNTNICPHQWQNTKVLENIQPRLQKQVQGAWRWKSLYNLQELRRCVSKIQPLNYRESKNLFSLLTVTPVSSGYCLGGANWMIETYHEKVIYVADTSIITPRHPEIIDSNALGKVKVEGEMGNKSATAEAIILSSSCITSEPSATPDKMVPKALRHIGMTINNNGNVLIPTYSCGVIFDMFENIKSFLLQRMKRAPVFFISPVAEHSLAYANIIAEWFEQFHPQLSKERQEKVYLPEAPFPHEEMVNSDLLFHYKNMDELFASGNYQEPCIVFAGHPSLRCGAAEKFLRLWGQQETSAVLFLEPGFDYAKAIAPFQPLKIRIFPCPIDWRVSPEEINDLMKQVSPKQLIVPECYGNPQNEHTAVRFDTPTTIYTPNGVQNISLKRNLERATISAGLAKQLKPSACGSMLITDFSASLSTFDNQYSFGQASLSDLHTLRLNRQRHLTGSPNANNIIDQLRQMGHEPSQVENGAEETTLTYTSLAAVIQVSASKTTISCADDSNRQVIAACVVKQCQDLSTK